MSYLQKSLAADEAIVAVFRLHWSMWIRFWVVTLVGIVAVVALLVAGLRWAALAVAIVALLIAGQQWLWLRGVEQGVTNRRVVRKTGIVSRRTTELRLASIETIDLHQGFWGRVFGSGDVEITGRGEANMVLERMAHPLDVKRAIEGAYSTHVELRPHGATA